MNKIFKLVSVDAEKAIIEVGELDLLDLAEHPYLDVDNKYITVTRGDDHILKVINKDGSSWSIVWGYHGATRCGDLVNKLKGAVVDFLQNECGILLDMTIDNSEIEGATVFYNRHYGSWGMTVYAEGQNQSVRLKGCKDKDEAIEKATKFVGHRDWNYLRSETGLDTWEAVYDLSGQNICAVCPEGWKVEGKGWYCGKTGTFYHKNGCVKCKFLNI